MSNNNTSTPSLLTTTTSKDKQSLNGLTKALPSRPNAEAPVKGARIVSRSAPEDGGLTKYVLQIGNVNVPDITIYEIFDYVSPQDVETFENAAFARQITASDAEKRTKKAKLLVHQRQRKSSFTSSSSSEDGSGIDNSGNVSEVNVASTLTGRRPRPNYTHFYPPQRARRADSEAKTKKKQIVQVVVPSSRQTVSTNTHTEAPSPKSAKDETREFKRQKLEQGRRGTTTSSDTGESVYSIGSPEFVHRPGPMRAADRISSETVGTSGRSSSTSDSPDPIQPSDLIKPTERVSLQVSGPAGPSSSVQAARDVSSQSLGAVKPSNATEVSNRTVARGTEADPMEIDSDDSSNDSVTVILPDKKAAVMNKKPTSSSRMGPPNTTATNGSLQRSRRATSSTSSSASSAEGIEERVSSPPISTSASTKARLAAMPPKISSISTAAVTAASKSDFRADTTPTRNLPISKTSDPNNSKGKQRALSPLPPKNPTPPSQNSLNQPNKKEEDQDQEESGEEEIYTIEKILRHQMSDPRTHNSGTTTTTTTTTTASSSSTATTSTTKINKPVMLYQVKWTGYEELTWEPAESFEDPAVLGDYWRGVNARRKKKVMAMVHS